MTDPLGRLFPSLGLYLGIIGGIPGGRNCHPTPRPRPALFGRKPAMAAAIEPQLEAASALASPDSVAMAAALAGTLPKGFGLALCSGRFFVLSMSLRIRIPRSTPSTNSGRQSSSSNSSGNSSSSGPWGIKRMNTTYTKQGESYSPYSRFQNPEH